MGWPSLLVLVRHAESEGNLRTAEERATFDRATHNYALTERGREQARLTGEFIRNTYADFDAYYVSYYRRSHETMKIMYPDAKIYEDPRLAEAQRGIWHMMTNEQVKMRFPEEIERKEREGLYHYRPFGGENWPDVELRIHSFLGTLNRDQHQKRVFMVVHGHWLLLFQRLIHHFSIDESVKRYKDGIAENASVTVYHTMGRPNAPLLHMIEHLVPWEGKI
ncbi:hypothetical protein A3E39_01695 [Candidatus Uhrbacteria bacterium RIFCSPHIGHO2_12_FULL_60_25]|uniref:phosphoglycerate mutase (2,3-diphosphoglycerate-dependent) n=1 Tax=Candidatus Uhrbacteria bacterium RIFCSPHIGHO2_12_FULL_60_25 TaxID=1802399 RepID=A0A1F7UK33_9BACT|nr:MAG: hypothetical protein A3D73_01865 [Candidatus Uhrbacteria bacterium RIFCSPHIGHO2_02_FULL_60_44]OGL78629.1 MAG: hypothetical protein A3E39_01695 [Candidatus Uhrbacteria bacterium RIFCSPHIGHO2_12_FULL_60_25]